MCGVFGFASFGAAPIPDAGTLDRMAAALRHRGPDGEGRYCTASAVLGVTRLRVVDLDPRADQPFASPDGTVAIAVNGEIYNAADIRRRYPQYPFRSRSDVECLLPLYLDRGPAAVSELDGMFAVAIWDARQHALILARDRAGEKPLFYAQSQTGVAFASEIAAVLEYEGLRRQLDRDALAGFLLRGYVPQPATMFRSVRQVPAGSVVTVTDQGMTARRYWDPAAHAGDADTSTIRHLLETAVEKQTAADVPVGIFTSGGLDSAILATLGARTLGTDRITTFSVGFRDRSYDERSFARRLARELGVRHVAIEADPTEMRAALDALVGLGEPIADPAAMPTALLARAARERVTVVLSGEGGDELFGGYPTYLGHRLAARFASLPGVARGAIGAIVRHLPSSDRRVPLSTSANASWPRPGDPSATGTWLGSGLDCRRVCYAIRPWPSGPPLTPPNGAATS